MNKISILFCILFFAMSISTFAQSKDEKAKSAIRQVMEVQTAAWNKGDIEGFMQGYWNSPDMRFVSGDNVARGWQAALDRYKKSYDSKAKMGFLTFSDLDITVLSKDSAVVLGSWNLDREVDGKKDNPHGKFTLIFRKFKTGWKIVHDHTS
jgi:ketosteroid isomerase-like protein